MIINGPYDQNFIWKIYLKKWYIKYIFSVNKVAMRPTKFPDSQYHSRILEQLILVKNNNNKRSSQLLKLFKLPVIKQNKGIQSNKKIQIKQTVL